MQIITHSLQLEIVRPLEGLAVGPRRSMKKVQFAADMSRLRLTTNNVSDRSTNNVKAQTSVPNECERQTTSSSSLHIFGKFLKNFT